MSVIGEYDELYHPHLWKLPGGMMIYMVKMTHIVKDRYQ